jgi:hypothetical protein
VNRPFSRAAHAAAIALAAGMIAVAPGRAQVLPPSHVQEVPGAPLRRVSAPVPPAHVKSAAPAVTPAPQAESQSRLPAPTSRQPGAGRLQLPVTPAQEAAAPAKTCWVATPEDTHVTYDRYSRRALEVLGCDSVSRPVDVDVIACLVPHPHGQGWSVDYAVAWHKTAGWSDEELAEHMRNHAEIRRSIKVLVNTATEIKTYEKDTYPAAPVCGMTATKMMAITFTTRIEPDQLNESFDSLEYTILPNGRRLLVIHDRGTRTYHKISTTDHHARQAPVTAEGNK